MSAASSPGPQNLIILAAIGMGAYWFMTRRAAAGTAPPVLTGAQASGQPNTAQQVVGLLGAVKNLFGGSSNLMGTVDGRSATQWDVTPFGPSGPTFNNPSAYVSGGFDGLAVNPPNSSGFDWLSGGGFGTGTGYGEQDLGAFL